MRKCWVFLLVIAFIGASSLYARAERAADKRLGDALTEQVFGVGERILGCDMPPPGPPNEETEKRAEMSARYPDNSSLTYRGVAFGNFNNSDNAEEFAVDFGSSGLWVRDSGTWHQISGLNPSWIIAGTVGLDTSDDELVAGFGSYGVWVWLYSTGYPGTWIQISGASSSSAFVFDDDDDGKDEIYVDFASLGIWRHDYASNNWTQFSSVNPNTGMKMAGISAGLWAACVSFPTHGIWRLRWTTTGIPAYYQLTGTTTAEDDHASAMFLGGANEDLVLDFGSLGLWLLQYGGGWHQIDTQSVNRVREVYFIGNPDAELLIRYNTPPTGLWMWNYNGFPGDVTQLHAWTPDADGFVEPFDMNGDTETNGDQEVAVDFGTEGLWIYDNTSTSWTKISSLDPQFMVAGDYYGDGFASSLVVDFGATYGLWVYDGLYGGWLQVSALSPDSVT